MTRLFDLINEKKATVGVIGLGYVGLPLVREFVGNGFRVVGFDTNEPVGGNDDAVQRTANALSVLLTTGKALTIDQVVRAACGCVESVANGF